MPLHERQRTWCLPHFRKRSISIHASTWEATRKSSLYWWKGLISIHASTWEATHSVSHSQGRYLLFQFTPLHERQLKLLKDLQVVTYFNSRLYTRGDHPVYLTLILFWYFNSRLYTKGDNLLTLTAIFSLISILASTREATAADYRHADPIQISILASAWEATRFWYTGTNLQGNFNSRLYMRGNWRDIIGGLWLNHFNSRLYMRGNP